MEKRTNLSNFEDAREDQIFKEARRVNEIRLQNGQELVKYRF